MIEANIVALGFVETEIKEPAIQIGDRVEDILKETNEICIVLGLSLVHRSNGWVYEYELVAEDDSFNRDVVLYIEKSSFLIDS